MKQQKRIELDVEVIRILSKLAIDSPQRNFKNFVEYQLEQMALTNTLKELQK